LKAKKMPLESVEAPRSEPYMHDGTMIALAARVAVLEAKMAIQENNLERLVTAQENMARDIHIIRELIATGKGAYWGGVAVLAALGLVAGSIGALIHKVLQ
jgi:hypothetical protein